MAITKQTPVIQSDRGVRLVTVLRRTRVWSSGKQRISVQDIRPGNQVRALAQWLAGLVLVHRPASPAPADE